MQIDNQIASRHWRLCRAIPTTFRAAPGYRFDAIVTVQTVERPSAVSVALPQKALPAHPQSNESVRARAWVWARTPSAGRNRTASAALVAVALLIGALLI